MTLSPTTPSSQCRHLSLNMQEPIGVSWQIDLRVVSHFTVGAHDSRMAPSCESGTGRVHSILSRGNATQVHFATLD